MHGSQYLGRQKLITVDPILTNRIEREIEREIELDREREIRERERERDRKRERCDMVITP